ncbi:MAG: aminoacyl-tRNA hydrolase [Patescibacteria group bacterium]
MKTIIGLGNKGKEYQKTRHNIGEHVVRVMAEAMGGTFEYNKHLLSNVAEIDGVQFIIPELYMNESGKVLDCLYKMKNNEAEYPELLIVRDDIDMGIGNVKTIFDGGSGGHNGINSIHTHLKSKKFHQIKIGVLPVDAEGKVLKPSQGEVNDFVTGKFTRDEWELMIESVKKAVVLIEEFIQK